MTEAAARQPRRRNAAATRAAILASARRAFAKSGYDGAGVREIAAGAGVTAMLVNRYFGSKEKLFAEVCTDTMRDPVILSAANLAAEDFPAAFAKALVQVTAPGETPLDGFLVLLHSASSPRAAEIGLDPARSLADNDSTGFFEALGDLLQPGPTLTNVNDCRVILIEP